MQPVSCVPDQSWYISNLHATITASIFISIANGFTLHYQHSSGSSRHFYARPVELMMMAQSRHDSTPVRTPLPIADTTAGTLRIQIASDLHIEFYESIDNVPSDLIKPQAPVLALLGDIGLAFSDVLRDFLFEQCNRFKQVLFLAGNHEFYNADEETYSMEEQTEWMRQTCSQRDNLHFMEKDSLVMEGVVILGTTLWSNIPDCMLKKAQRSLNDYCLTYNHRPGESPRKLRADETTDMYQLNIGWIRSELAKARENGQKVLVLTHHTPSMEGTSHPQYDGSDISCCFSSDLRLLLEEESPNLVAWACGHTHYNFDFLVGNVRVCSNQRGYKFGPSKAYRKDGVVLEVSAA